MKTELGLLMCLVTLTMGAVSKVQNVVDQPNITTMELVRLVESAESTKSIDFNDMETAANDDHHHVPDIQQYVHQPTYSNYQNPTSYRRKNYYPQNYYPYRG